MVSFCVHRPTPSYIKCDNVNVPHHLLVRTVSKRTTSSPLAKKTMGVTTSWSPRGGSGERVIIVLGVARSDVVRRGGAADDVAKGCVSVAAPHSVVGWTKIKCVNAVSLDRNAYYRCFRFCHLERPRTRSKRSIKYETPQPTSTHTQCNTDMYNTRSQIWWAINYFE